MLHICSSAHERVATIATRLRLRTRAELPDHLERINEAAQHVPWTCSYMFLRSKLVKERQQARAMRKSPNQDVMLTKMSCPDCFPCCPFLEQALIWHQWAWNASEHLQLKHIETIASSFSCADSSAKGAKGISAQIFRSPSEVKLRPLPSLRTNAQSKRPRHCQTSPETRRRTVGSPCDKGACW